MDCCIACKSSKFTSGRVTPPCKHSLCITCFYATNKGIHKSCSICNLLFYQEEDDDINLLSDLPNCVDDILQDDSGRPVVIPYKFDEDVEWTPFTQEQIAKCFKQPELAEKCFQEAKFGEEHGYIIKKEMDGKEYMQSVFIEDVYLMYKNAAYMGHAEAALKEGDMRLKGSGTSQATTIATCCYRTSAALGNKDAIVTLIWLFRHPEFSKKLLPSYISHEEKALMWEKRLLL